MNSHRLLFLCCITALTFLSYSASRNAFAETRKPWTTSNIKGAPTPPAPYAIKPAFPNISFQKPTSLEELPDGRILVSEFGGTLYTFPKNQRQIAEADVLLKLDESTIWHATAHPNYKSNQELFVCYVHDGTTHVSRFNVGSNPPFADLKSEQVLITWPAGGHNGGCIRFGKDGMLHISTGDGSGPNPPDGLTAAQDVSNLFGCILRIDVDKADQGKKYSIPKDNPFVDLENARPEIWAYGLRNPWKFGVDAKSGNIFAADNGWESWEMVHQIVRGGNCGWPIMEGRAVLRSEVKQGPTPIRPPVKDHSHTEANSVIGGPIYRGSKLPGLDGTFVYGDYITGTIWGLKSEGDNKYSHQTLVDTDQRITAFAEGSDGELFVLDYDFTGKIYELQPSGLKDTSADFPRKLSETGLFTSLEDMAPAAGVLPYEVVAKRWDDGANTQRWVAIPDAGSISLATPETPASYPEGTVFVKHLTMPQFDAGRKPLPLETQILHFENGMWRPYSYLWNDDGKDAVLTNSAGADREIKYSVMATNRYASVDAERTWHVSAENECRLCHNAGSGYVLGFVANQLNRRIRSGDQVIEQLPQLSSLEVLNAVPRIESDDPGRLVNPHDTRQSLNDRARSYLHANCSSCHHPKGNAIVSFYLRRELPFNELKTNKDTGIGTFGLQNAKLIVPGDPYRSVLLYRMSKLGYARMPYIGSRVVDSKGVALIAKWIGSMPHQISDQDSAPIKKDSDEYKSLMLVLSKDKAGNHLKAAETLLKSSEGALALSTAMHRGGVHWVSRAKAYEAKQSDIRGLFETFIPEKLRRKRLGRNAKPDAVLSLKGSVDRGRLIFFSDGARCRNCHDVDNEAKSTGPTLAAIRKKYKRRSELLQHILQPSLKVDEKFAMWNVVTLSGNSHSGLIVRQSDAELVLKTAERKQVTIPKSEIDLMRKSTKSLMPEGILSDLTAQEAADLLSWFGNF